MAMTTASNALTAEEVVAKLRELRARQPVKYWAFYSSQLGGIVTDPALMVVPFDDHMVHRGHGVFDTAAIVDGKIYDLEAHLDRFIRSAKTSKLRLPCSREEMRDDHRADRGGQRQARGLDPLLDLRRARAASGSRRRRAPSPASS